MLVRAVAAEAVDEDVSGERLSTFITPALTSPLGPRSGWKRAEIDVLLPAGTRMNVAWASTDNAGLISRAADLFNGPATAQLVDQLIELLPWRTDQIVAYRATGSDAGPESLAALLGTVQESTLWLRIDLHTPPGRTPPEPNRIHLIDAR